MDLLQVNWLTGENTWVFHPGMTDFTIYITWWNINQTFKIEEKCIIEENWKYFRTIKCLRSSQIECFLRAGEVSFSHFHSSVCFQELHFCLSSGKPRPQQNWDSKSHMHSRALGGLGLVWQPHIKVVLWQEVPWWLSSPGGGAVVPS